MIKYETDTNLRYEVDPVKGTVTCFVDNCIDDFRNVFLKKSCSVKNGNKIADMLDYIITKHIDCGIEDTYFGVAVCDKEDKFNLDVGADLARSRALAKREMAYGNVIISVLNFLEEISEFVPEIRNVVGLYNKHNTNANAISASGKTLAEIRGFENERKFVEDR